MSILSSIKTEVSGTLFYLYLTNIFSSSWFLCPRARAPNDPPTTARDESISVSNGMVYYIAPATAKHNRDMLIIPGNSILFFTVANRRHSDSFPDPGHFAVAATAAHTHSSRPCL